MIAGIPLTFAFPMVLTALALLPVIWWLLRLTPPRPQSELFPPLAILARLIRKEETPAKSPWWLTLLRLAMAAFVILAMAGPILNPRGPPRGEFHVLRGGSWFLGARYCRSANRDCRDAPRHQPDGGLRGFLCGQRAVARGPVHR